LRKQIIVFLITLFLSAQNINAQTCIPIEIYGIHQEMVIKTIESNCKINNIVIDYLNKINNIKCSFNPIPKSGIAVKIPLSAPIKVQNKFFNAIINDVIVMYPENQPPFLMLFDTLSQ
jgi:hypothetical protein